MFEREDFYGEFVEILNTQRAHFVRKLTDKTVNQWIAEKLKLLGSGIF